MEIKRIVLSYLDANCYIISSSKKCLIVDPGWDSEKIIDTIGNKTVLGILVTHYHQDHISALDEIKEKYNAQVYSFKTKEKNIKLDNFSFHIIPTPGHTDDSVSYFFLKEGIIFTGDFLFKGTIGRTDLPTGDNLKMYDSLKRIKKYSDDIVIYPGHGESTTIKEEKENNIFLRD